MAMVEITTADFDVEIALAYATADNITGKAIYRQAAAICTKGRREDEGCGGARGTARPPVQDLRRLSTFRGAVEALGGLPQRGVRRQSPARLAAQPRRRGIDLTLIDADGRALDMGTGFDEMSALSHHARTDIPAEAQRNRFTLMGIMSAAGWDFYKNEWLHYQLFNARDYALVDQARLPKPLM